MSNDIKINIIQKARDLIYEDNKIKKLFFLPWLFSIIFLTLILVYQTIYTYVEIFQQEDKILRIILNIFHAWYLLEIIIWFLIFLIIYIIIIPLYEWTLISYISKKNDNNTAVSIYDSFWVWLYRFLPLFEFWNIFDQFKFITTVNIYLFCLRFIWLEYILYLSIAFIFLLFISTIVNILFAYAKFEIVLNNKSAIEAINESIKISTLNLYTTTKLYFYMFILNIRIIINFLVFLFFPFIITTAITYITTKIFLIITIIILSIIFCILIVILWYLSWVFEILTISIRYFAYIEWKNNILNNEIKNEEQKHNNQEKHN